VHYLITGHTGFKGAWLAIWLLHRGHQVSGISLDPEPGALFEAAGLSSQMAGDLRIDIRQNAALDEAVKSLAPDVVMHLAAQPLVRESYRDPRTTVETNVMGTLNLLQAVSATPTVKAQVIVTTDKVYRNVRQIWGAFRARPPPSPVRAMSSVAGTSAGIASCRTCCASSPPGRRSPFATRRPSDPGSTSWTASTATSPWPTPCSLARARDPGTSGRTPRASYPSA